MKTFLLSIIATMMFVSCNTENTPNDVNRTSTINEVIMTRRSIRKYQDNPINQDTLNVILSNGLNAPNGKGIQAYEIRVVNNPQLLKEISDAVAIDKPEVVERQNYKNIFVDAPCVVFIAADTTYDMSQVDCGLLGENIILSAWSMGIGSCCLGSSVRMIKNSKTAMPFLNKMEFSDGYELLYCIALGYPAETPEQRPRNVEKVRFIDAF